MTTFGTFLDGSFFFGLLAFAGLGLDATYPELKLDSYLNDAGRKAFAQAAGFCSADWLSARTTCSASPRTASR